MKKNHFMKSIVNIFLACVALLVVSCGGKEKKHYASPCDSLCEVYKLKSVTHLADIKDGDSAIFKAPNNKCYLVVSYKTETKDGQKDDAKVSATANPTEDCDKFTGTDRKAARTSAANAYTLLYKNISSFIKSLPGDDEMGKTHIPDIKIDSNSKRADEEQKNVHIKRSLIYAIALQADRDYRIIIGDSSDISKAEFFNITISGLPGKKSASYDKLSKSRQAFKDFFGINNCKRGNAFIFVTPIEIEFVGSLFFDKYGFDNKSDKGLKEFRSKTYWEIHPVFKIKYL